ncbi:hypothetical protein D915_003668 [Fasciola hepatica]|uniref:Uncharacterized protein n=1 Tax=Fasciola hepatica TaxID=6192 RepID=A0A4E0RVV1_FASHE|nr:hypothetical protein D915_003668 [Fasciola hepatica]
MWMACLELLAGANEEEPNEGVWSTTAPAKTPASEFNAAEAESIERNQCIVLGLHGLTRLLLDVSLRPRPGDPIHSSVPHQPRLSTPHFSYTRLGRKLTSLTSMIEYERLRLHLPYGGTCPNFTTAAVTIPVNAAATNPSVHALSASSSCTWFGQLISPDATDSVAELASSVEANLERLADAPDSVPGPSQFAVHWLVRRLMPRTDEGPDKGDGTEETKADTELNSAQMDQFRNEDFVLNSRPYRVIPAAHSIADYEDLLFSCLQSTQLLYQSWLRSPTMNSSTSYTDSFPDGPNADASSVSISTPTSSSAFSGANAGTGTTPRPVSSESQNEIVSQKGLALAPLLAVIRSTVILSDLFTSREQFLWLTHYLQDVQDKLPSPKEFPAPIHYWITLGLARCVAVLELARSGPQTEPLHEATLEPVVRQILAVLQTNVTILQDVGLQASMLLLHAALLIRAQPHQRQTQQHSPPTGSPSLNELYSQICLYLEQKLVTLFTPPAPVSPSSSSSVSASSKSTGETFRPVPGTPRWIPTPATDATKSSSGSGTSAGFKRFMSGVFGGGGGVGFGGTKGSLTGTGIDATVKFDSVGTGMHIGSSSSSFPAPGSASLVNRVERHQLIVLATAFFLTEHFSAPPIYPVLTDFGSGLTEMLSGLTSNLFRLAQSMLSDNAAFLASSSGTNISALSHYAVLGAGTTSDLYYSPAVHAAWCRGIERLVLMGRLGKGATESLQKLCVMRLRTCRSAHLSLPVLRLLITCMYTNAGRLNTQLQHYRRVSPTGDKATSTSGFSSSSVNRVTESKAIRPSDSASVTYALSKKLPETTTKRDLATLPPSLLTDSEATAGMTQEFLSCLWERLRGGVAPVMHTSGEPSWVTSAWTSAAEASVIAHLLPVASTDIIQAIAGLLVHNSPQSQASQLGWDRLVIDGHLEDPVLNKALGEFARLDHAHPDLAAQTLAQLFGRFLDRPGGQALIRQWVILSLPTLLSRQPRRLAIWATTVCLLAASTEPSLRAALCLCSTQVAFTYTSDSAEYRDPSGESSQLSSAYAIAFRQQTSPLLSDLLCLSAVHFVRSGLLSRSGTSLDEELIEHRQAFRRMFEPLPGGEFEFCAATADPDERTLRRVYTLLQRELAGDN